MREVTLFYQAEDTKHPWGEGASLPFAEFKFRELMAWSNNLPPHLLSNKSNPHHVHVLQSVIVPERIRNCSLTKSP